VLKDRLKAVMTIGFNEWRLSDTWSCDERHRDCLLPEDSSERTIGPCWEQLSADLIEISQRKHGLRPRQVLGQAGGANRSDVATNSRLSAASPARFSSWVSTPVGKQFTFHTVFGKQFTFHTL